MGRIAARVSLGCVLGLLAQMLQVVRVAPAAALIAVGALDGHVGDVEVRDGLAYVVSGQTFGSPRRGGVRVALLGSRELDVATAHPTGLEFGPHRALSIAPPRARDVNRDGFPDLVAGFRKRETGIERGDTQACLRGQLLDGTRFEGCDAIRTPPPGSGL